MVCVLAKVSFFWSTYFRFGYLDPWEKACHIAPARNAAGLHSLEHCIAGFRSTAPRRIFVAWFKLVQVPI